MVEGGIALVFPGQASFQPGMGQSLFSGFAEVREEVQITQEALQTAGRKEALAQLLYAGSEDELNQTPLIHPLLYALSLGAGRHFLNQLDRGVGLLGGYSLGEYPALTLAQVLERKRAAFLVTQRARLLDKCEGSVARIRGKAETVQRLLSGLKGWTITAFNSPDLVNIAGSEEVIDLALQKLKEAKIVARRVSVNVSHSPLVQAAADQFAGYLRNTSLGPARIPVLNASAGKIHRWGSFREILKRQLISPVCWEQSVLAAWDSGISIFVEVGAVSYLAKLIRHIVPEAIVYSITDRDSMQGTLEIFKG